MSADEAKEPCADVDVVIPSYQYGRFLRDCVMSVLSQGLRDVRVLIIDNASTDNSVEVAQQLAAEDRRVEVVVHRRNLGAQASYNEGIDWANSKYFTILCADDLLAPGSLARAIAAMERHSDVALKFGRVLYLSPQDEFPLLDASHHDTDWRVVAGGDLLERSCRTGRPLSDSCGMVVRTVAQKLAGYYRAELPHSDDFEMWMRLLCLGPAAITKAVQGIRRVHGSSLLSLAQGMEHRDDGYRLPLDLWRDKAAFDSFFAHEGNILPEAARLCRLARRGLAERAYWSALTHLCGGQPDVVLDLLRFAVRRRPRTAVFPPIGYLVWRDDFAGRVTEIATEMIARHWAGVRLGRAGG